MYKNLQTVMISPGWLPPTPPPSSGRWTCRAKCFKKLVAKMQRRPCSWSYIMLFNLWSGTTARARTPTGGGLWRSPLIISPGMFSTTSVIRTEHYCMIKNDTVVVESNNSRKNTCKKGNRIANC